MLCLPLVQASPPGSAPPLDHYTAVTVIKDRKERAFKSVVQNLTASEKASLPPELRQRTRLSGGCFDTPEEAACASDR